MQQNMGTRHHFVLTLGAHGDKFRPDNTTQDQISAQILQALDGRRHLAPE